MELEDVKKPLKKVIEVFYDDRVLLGYFMSKLNIEDNKLNVQNLETLATSKMLGTHPEVFGITKSDCDNIREYFSEGAKSRDYEFVPELHDNFSCLSREEDHRYLDDINRYRIQSGLYPIN